MRLEVQLRFKACSGLDRVNLPVFAGILAVLLAGAPALAASKTYVGGAGTGSWNTGTNWSPTGAPVAGDNVSLTPLDNFNRTVIYPGFGSFLVNYGGITINSSIGAGSITVQNGTAGLAGSTLSLGPRGKLALGTTAFGSFAAVGISGGTLEGAVSGLAGSSFAASSYNHLAGVLKNGNFAIGDSYLLQGGLIAGSSFSSTRITNDGTFSYLSGGASAGLFTNNGTIIYSGSGSLNFYVTNNGTIILNSDASFDGLTNNTSMTVPAGTNLFTSELRQQAGTFTQLGGIIVAQNTGAAGATLDLRDGMFVGDSLNAADLNADGTILLGSGSLEVNFEMVLGNVNSTGSCIQSGGSAMVGSYLFVGTGTNAGGYYGIGAGSMTSPVLILGAASANFASYVQTGGNVTVGSLVLNQALNGTTLSISGGNFTANADYGPAINNAQIGQTGGRSQFLKIDGNGSITMSGSGSMTATSLRQQWLDLAGDGKVLVSTTPSPTNNRLSLLTFDETGGTVHGTFDIADVPLIIDYSSSPPMSSIRRYLASGYASGNWNGMGLRSLTAALDAQRRTGLGYVKSSDIFRAGSGVFENEDVDGTSVLVLYTLFGDANLNRAVDSVDFNLLSASFGQDGRFWFDGDFDYDGSVSTIDFNLLASNFGQALSGPVIGTLVPEPAGLLAVYLSLWLVSRFRRDSSRIPRVLLLTLPAVGISLISSSAQAVNRVWIRGAGTGNWATSTNWSPTGAPQPGDAVFLTAADSFSKTAIFDSASFAVNNSFQQLTIDESGPGNIRLLHISEQLFANTLNIGLSGTSGYDLQGGTALFVTATLGSSGTMSITNVARLSASNFFQNGGSLNLGAGSTFTANSHTQSGGTFTIAGAYSTVNYTQNAGTIITTQNMSITGRYTHNGGAFLGPGALSAGTVTCGSFSLNGGTFGGNVDTSNLTIGGQSSGTFLSYLTHRGNLDVGGASIFVGRRFDQIGGSVLQNGFIGGADPNAPGGSTTDIGIGGGATWSYSKNLVQAAILDVGSGFGGGGSFDFQQIGGSTISTGPLAVRVSALNIGPRSDGYFTHGGRRVEATTVTVGGSGGFTRGPAPGPGKRGYYTINSGTLLADTLTVGAKDALLGVYTQTGGVVSLERFIANVNSTSNSVIDISGGSFVAADESINNGAFSMTGGSVFINSRLDGAGSISVTGAGSFIATRIWQDEAHLGGNGQMTIGGLSLGTLPPTTSRVRSLTFEEIGNQVQGRWELGKSRLLVDYSGASPIAAIQRYLASGYAGGNWNGAGLSSAGGAGGDPEHRTALGFAESSDIFGPSGGVFVDTFADATSIVIAYALYGDANLDSVVDSVDFNALAGSFGVGAGATWLGGDFDYSGSIDSTDFNLLASNFGQVLPAEADAPGMVVPEPAVGWIIMITSFALNRRRQRRCR